MDPLTHDHPLINEPHQRWGGPPSSRLRNSPHCRGVPLGPTPNPLSLSIFATLPKGIPPRIPLLTSSDGWPSQLAFISPPFDHGRVSSDGPKSHNYADFVLGARWEATAALWLRHPFFIFIAPRGRWPSPILLLLLPTNCIKL